MCHCGKCQTMSHIVNSCPQSSGITHAAMESLVNHFWKSCISIPTKLKLYNTCILSIFLYRSECWAVIKVDASRIDALDQWCLRTLLGIKWHQFVCNEEERRITKQPNLTAIIQSRHLFIFRHIARMDDDADAKTILKAPPPENWRDHQGVPAWRGSIPSSETWEPTTSHWIKQSTWPRTVLCGGWCLRMALHTPSGACQKRIRSPQSKLEGGCSDCTQLMTLLPNGWRHGS